MGGDRMHWQVVKVLCDSVSNKKVVHAFMEDPTVTVKTDRILFEEKLYGVELSTFALCDGHAWRWLGVACDHKRVGDNDTDPTQRPWCLYP